MKKVLFFALILLAQAAQVYAGGIGITNGTKETVTIDYKYFWVGGSGQGSAPIEPGAKYTDEKVGVWFGDVRIVPTIKPAFRNSPDVSVDKAARGATVDIFYPWAQYYTFQGLGGRSDRYPVILKTPVDWRWEATIIVAD